MSGNSDATPLSRDWIWSNTSNVHVCNDRRWFTSYTPFESRAGSIYSNTENMAVVGVGTIVLPVKKSPNRNGPESHGQIVLDDVIHCPQALCNIFAYPGGTDEDYVIKCGGGERSKGSITTENGSPVAYFDPKGTLYQIKLSGPPVGPVVADSVLKEGRTFMINVRWSEKEKARWTAHKQTLNIRLNNDQTSTVKEKNDPKETEPAGTDRDAPYTDEEKKWLKVNFKDEYHFLQQHGLSIYKEEDRAEGRSIVRAFMSQDK